MYCVCVCVCLCVCVCVRERERGRVSSIESHGGDHGDMSFTFPLSPAHSLVPGPPVINSQSPKS